MIRRATSPDDVNAVLSRIMPDLDSAALVTDERNVCLLGDGGGVLFAWRGPGVFEGHSFFLAEHRGAAAICDARAMLAMMRDQFGARIIWGLTPCENRASRYFNRICGMVSAGEIATPEGLCELFVLE